MKLSCPKNDCILSLSFGDRWLISSTLRKLQSASDAATLLSIRLASKGLCVVATINWASVTPNALTVRYGKRSIVKSSK